MGPIGAIPIDPGCHIADDREGRRRAGSAPPFVMLSASAYSFRQKSRLAISLSWVAGYTNVIAFLMCGHIVVSHVTGNITHFGESAAEVLLHPVRGAWRDVGYFGFLSGVFFAGAIA